MKTAIFGFLPGPILLDMSVKLLDVPLELPIHLLDGLPRRQLDGILLRLDLVLLLLGCHKLLLHLHYASLEVIHERVDTLLLVATGRGPRRTVIVWVASTTLVISFKDEVGVASPSPHLDSLSVCSCRIALQERVGP